MHRVVRRVGDPRLLIDHRNSPAALAIAAEMIEPRDGTVVDGEGEAPLRLIVECEADRRLMVPPCATAMMSRPACCALIRSMAALV